MNCASSSPRLERGDIRHGLLVSMGACSASRFRLHLPDRRRLRELALVSGRLHGPARWRGGHARRGALKATSNGGATRCMTLSSRRRQNRELLKELLAAPEPRELTLATQDPVLLRLPWELIADGAGRLAQRVSVRRQLEEPER